MKEKWYGYAGHLIVGKRCAYHLGTVVNGYLISTVGHFLPDGKTMETIGSGENDFFETMVFHCNGEDKDGNPNVLNWSNIDGERYADSTSAEKGHYVYLEKYRNAKVS